MTAVRQSKAAILYDPAGVDYGGRRHRGFQAECGGCAAKHTVPMQGMRGHPDDNRELQIITKKFEGLGWRVGSRRADHRCPGCVNTEQQRRQQPESTMPKGGVSFMNGQQKPAAPAPSIAPTAEPPETMTREDRRIIFEKLNEVYGSENSGYSGEWTDKKVGEDLGTPRAWVAKVREEMFGPEGGNAVIVQQIEEARKVIADGRKLLNEVSDLKLRADELQATANRLMRDTAPLLTLISRVEGRMIDVQKSLR